MYATLSCEHGEAEDRRRPSAGRMPAAAAGSPDCAAASRRSDSLVGGTGAGRSNGRAGVERRQLLLGTPAASRVERLRPRRRFEQVRLSSSSGGGGAAPASRRRRERRLATIWGCAAVSSQVVVAVGCSDPTRRRAPCRRRPARLSAARDDFAVEGCRGTARRRSCRLRCMRSRSATLTWPTQRYWSTASAGNRTRSAHVTRVGADGRLIFTGRSVARGKSL